MKLTGILDRKKKKKIALGGIDEVQKRLESESEVMPDSLRPIDSSLPGSAVHGIFQARILEWPAIPFSRGSSLPRDRTRISCIAGIFFID